MNTYIFEENLKSKIKSLRNNFILVFAMLISLTFVRCANMQTPTGGPKDSIPPVILSENPVNFKRNFTDKQIVLEFNEYIKLNNYQKEFSIFPDLEKQPDNNKQIVSEFNKDIKLNNNQHKCSTAAEVKHQPE